MFTMQDFIAFLDSKGMSRLVYLVGKYPDVVEPYLPKIKARLQDKGLLPRDYKAVTLAYTKKARRLQGQGSGGEYESPAAGYDRVRAPKALTDAEAFTQLAGLVDSALGDQPAALREALKKAFRDEAAKAA